MRWFIVFAGLFVTLLADGQPFRFRQYRVEHGLPSDVIKAVTQDTLGFFWIATDDGLVKYDGIRFTTYKSPFQSQYIKGFLNTRDGRLLAIGDLDLVEIRNEIDTVVFTSLLRGTRSPTDTTIWYPKSMYEDRHGNIWIAEPQSVVCYSGPGERIKRFDFGSRNRSPVYIRSFHFFEDERGQLYAVSYLGLAFRYEESTRSFIQLRESFPNLSSHIQYWNHNLWIAAGDALYKARVSADGIDKPERSLPITSCSYLIQSRDSAVWIGSFNDNLYRLKNNKADSVESINFNFTGINHLYESHEGDIWVSTDKGVVLLQRNYFELADIFSQGHFIEGMAHDPVSQTLYYCYKETLVRLTPNKPSEQESSVVYDNRDSYFQSLTLGPQGLWASADFRVLLFKDDRLFREWNFAHRGDFVHDITLDFAGNLWLAQARNSKVVMIDTGFVLHQYPVPINSQTEVNLVRCGRKGIYVASSGIDSYLFLKPASDSVFHNISLPVDFIPVSDLNIHDVAIQGDVLWIASTEGLLRYDHTTMKRVDLGETMTSHSVASVEVLDEHNILFSNSFGLVRYDITNGDYWLYDESAGLPSNTMTDHGIMVASDGRVWLGTSFGLAVATQPVINNTPTLTPYCLEAQVDGIARRFREGLEVPYGSFINLLFAPITFPENKINLQWKLDGDTTWRSLRVPQLTLTGLTSGRHEVLVRAKKNTGLGWSDPHHLTLMVDQPYWQGAGFITGILLVAVLIAWISYALTARLMKKRKEYLENLVNERTKDLQYTNEELTLRNTELDRFVYSASHDLSAPLKSILGLIMVARLDSSGNNHEQYMSMMERSVRKLEEFIQEVVSYSRNTRMPVKLEPINFTTFVQNLLQDHQYAPNFDKIHFHISDTTNADLMIDAVRLKIILNNLISNSIKFHVYQDERKPFINISLVATDTHKILTIEDNGRGIHEQHLQHIFDMFYRGEEQAQGSGLGLYILKESVTKLGGEVEAHSTDKQGATFIVKLPKI